MIGLRRSLLLAATAALLSSTSVAQDARGTFDEGVQALERGDLDGALAAFQRTLAADPSNEDAWEMWQATDWRLWEKMLTEEGELERVAKRLMSLAALGHQERQNDEAAIRALLAELDTDDVLKRTEVTRKLAANHGEYAVPMMIHALADQGNEDRRVLFMHTLTRMGEDVVPPLIVALQSDDAFLRRNVALTLGYIGDARAAGSLAAQAAGDEDDGAKSAAAQALQRLGVSGDALALLLAQGDAYHNQAPSVLRPYQFSRVVWSWDGATLVPTEVPRFLYADEMAKASYYRALALAPGSVQALAGVARVSVAETSRLAQMSEAGQDTGEWRERLANDEVAVQLAGAPALDLALTWSLDQDDQVAATGLCRALGRAASAATPGLKRALSAGEPVRGEAALASAHLGGVSADVISALADNASREVVQIAAVIDGDAARRDAVASALTAMGLHVNAWPTGARALASLRAIPGVDVLVIADTLPDLTFDQVFDEVRADPSHASTPVVVLTDDPETASELYGDDTAGTVTDAADLSAVDAALSGGVDGDRAQANALAARSAHALAHLAGTGVDVSAAADRLASTLATRPDEVTVAAMHALGDVGGARHVDSLVAVLSDAGRSDVARLAAANALTGVFGRNPQASDAAIAAMRSVAGSDAGLDIRSQTAVALGRLPLSAEERAALLATMRANVAQ